MAKRRATDSHVQTLGVGSFEETDQMSKGISPYNGVINKDDIFAPQIGDKGIVLQLNCLLTARIIRLNESSRNISIFGETFIVWDSRLKSKTNCSSCRGIRH